MRVRTQFPKSIAWLFILVLLNSSAFGGQGTEGQTDNSPDWYYPVWVAQAKYNNPITVLDTDSALGRYSVQTKQIGLKDLARFHGHLCDGLVLSFIEIKTALDHLFPDRVVDRTDLRAVSKNGPCAVDAVSYMTGARINFQTLRIDPAIDEGFIIQRISTGEAYRVMLKPQVMGEEQMELERQMREQRNQGKTVSAKEIDKIEELATALIRKVLNTPLEELVITTRLAHFQFVPNTTDFGGARGDIINKNMPRAEQPE